MKKAGLFLIGTAIISLAISIPVSNHLDDLQDRLKIKELDNTELELKIDKKETELERYRNKVEEIQRNKQKSDAEKDKEIQRLREELQAKKERESRVASSQTRNVTHTSSQQGCEQYRDIISQYDWPVEQAIQVCNVESGGVATADNMNDYHPSYGCSGSHGLYQINCGAGVIYDPAQNIKTAYEMFVANGRTFCTTSGWQNTCIKLGYL